MTGQHKMKKLFIVSIGLITIAGLGYFFRMYLLAALMMVAPDLAISIIVADSKSRVDAVNELVSEATALPTEQAIEELRKLIREHPLENETYQGRFDRLVRMKAVDAIGKSPVDAQVAAIPEIMDVFSRGYGATSSTAHVVLGKMRGHAAPAIPELIRNLETGEPFWRKLHAAQVLRTISVYKPEAFTDSSREHIVVVISDLILSDETSIMERENYLNCLENIDSHGQFCLPLLKGLALDDSKRVQDEAQKSLIQIGLNNMEVRKWLEEFTDVDLERAYGEEGH